MSTVARVHEQRERVVAPPACRACGATLARQLFAVNDGFALVECGSCGLVATTPPLAPGELAAWYPPAYYGDDNRRFNPLFERLVGWFRRRRADAIEGYVSHGALLDVGCGRGLLPLILRRRGWEVRGVEMSESAAAHARRLGIPVFIGDLCDSSYPPGRFDVVVLWHVLEHLTNPAGTLGRVRELLRSGGLLVVAAPNFSSLQARLSGRHWFHLDVPRHTVHFRLPTLLALLERHGFTVVSVRHFNLEQNPFGWMQSLLNRFGLRRNLLYELLKNETSRSDRHPLRRYPLQSVVTILLLPLVLPLGLVLFLLETALRSGATVEIYARAGGAGESEARAPAGAAVSR